MKSKVIINFTIFAITLLTFSNLFGQNVPRISLYSSNNVKYKYFKEAIESGNTEKVKMYLDSGINPNVVFDENVRFNNKGLSPLVYAFQINKLDIAKLLIENGANKDFSYNVTVYYTGKYNMLESKEVQTNILNEVIQTNNYEAVKLLIDLGANKENSVSQAKASNNEKIIDLFKNSGATVQYNSSDLESAVKAGKPLSYINEILSQNVKPTGWTLIYAVERSDKNLINTLLNAGANINQTVSASNGASWCAICTAVNYGDFEMVKFLVEEKNADLNSICQVRDYVQNSTYSLIQFSESGNCWRKNKNVTEYLLLAPSIQKKKEEDRKKKIDEYIAKANDFLKNDEITNAKKEFEKAGTISGKVNHNVDIDVINYYYNQKNNEKVIKLSEDFDKEDKNFSIQLYKAYAYLNLKKNNEALNTLNKCNQLNPNSFYMKFNYSVYYATINDFEKAYDYMKKALEMGYKNWDFIDKSEYLNLFRQTNEFKKLERKFR